jgi:hypothetical protein
MPRQGGCNHLKEFSLLDKFIKKNPMFVFLTICATTFMQQKAGCFISWFIWSSSYFGPPIILD